MSNFWVVEGAGGGWDVWEESIDDPLSHHETRAAAIEAAHPLLEDTGGGELIVQDRHGRIRRKTTVRGRTRTRSRTGPGRPAGR